MGKPDEDKYGLWVGLFVSEIELKFCREYCAELIDSASTMSSMFTPLEI